MPKRSFLLTLFFLLGFLPVLGFLLVGVYHQTGSCVRNYGVAAEKELGLPVEMKEVRHHTPSQGEIAGLTIFQPGLSEDGTRNPLIFAPGASWIQYDTLREGKTVHLTKWTFPELTLDINCLEPLWRSHLQILADPQKRKKLRLEDSELLFTVEKKVKAGFQEPLLELSDAELRIRQEAGTPVTELRFLVPDEGRNAQIFIKLHYVVKNTAQSMQATLITDSAGISVKFLKPLFPMLNALGDSSKFTGYIVIEQFFSRWYGVFRGRFDRVNMENAVPGGNLTGFGTLEVEKARFDGSHMICATGKLRVENGTISRPFLSKIQRLTQLFSGEWPAGEKILFTEMAFRFQLNDSQIQIIGECSNAGPGVFLNGTSGPLLMESSVQRSPFSRAYFMEALK